MSTRLCLFGVAPSVDETSILAAARGWLEGLSQRPAVAHVGIQDEAAVRARRWFYFLFDRSWSWSFEPAARGLAAHFGEMTAILYNDGHGVFKFEHRQKGDDGKPKLVLGINTVGSLIEVYEGTLKGTYPQSGFSPAELNALNDKPWDTMTEREQDAVSNYVGAVTIGVNELFPGDERAHVSVGFEKVFHQIVDKGVVIAPTKVSQKELSGALGSFPSEWQGSIYS